MALRNAKITGLSGIQLNAASEVISSETVYPLICDTDGYVLFATGATVPTDGTSGYAKSCLFIDTDVATGTGSLYLNKGVNSSCAFTLVTQA